MRVPAQKSKGPYIVDATLRLHVQKATRRDASAAIKRRSVAKRVLQIFDTRRADPCVVGGAILQISYIIPTIGYIYRRTYERMRERDKNYLTSLLLIICANL